MLLGIPIVPAPIPMGVGAALAIKQTGRTAVAVSGDASIEEGVFHESAHFAALSKLPAIFVCENNLYWCISPLRVRQPPRRSRGRVAACYAGLARRRQ